ncbi:MAG: hypothetical protein JW788_05230, partial [Candidatus Omnitrophica bacterium]|nr:hypothetical protein [Candidatus Omnitrophota bacterium]
GKIRDGSFVVGDAISSYKEGILKSAKGVRATDIDYWYPQAYNIIDLAQEAAKAEDFADPFKAEPIYLYPKECQIKGKSKK